MKSGTCQKVCSAQPKRSAHRRRAAAVIEFAACLPIIVLLILGSLEATSAIFLRQALATSAYEGIRAAVRTSGSTATAQLRAQAVLDARRIRQATITFTPSDIGSAARGSLVTIEVAAPFAANSPFMGRVISDRISTVRTVMVKE